MIPLNIQQINTIVNGEAHFILDDKATIEHIYIDSRQIIDNSLFIALIGANFDGHSFVEQAIKSGASLVIVEHKIEAEIPQIIVKDTRIALGQLAAFVRAQLKTKIVALTGSSGKTSVKEMTASILQNNGQTLYTQGNYNNDIGVPLTLLRLTPQDKFAVIELGANHLGEIAYTTDLVDPQTVLINNIAEAHIEGFGSLEGVAKAKSEIFQGLSIDGIAIINLDSCRENWFSQLADKKIWTFSLHNMKADFYATDIQHNVNTHFILHTPKGECAISLPLIGEHNISNVLAATALAMSVGATLDDVKPAIANLKPVKGRLFPIQLNSHQLILDDTYNANVGSMTVALNTLASQSGYKILVVGDMAELGEKAAYYHQQIGELAQKLPIDCVISVGNLSRFISQYSLVGHHFDQKQDAVNYLNKLLEQHEQTTLLVKGSRSSKMEELITKFQISQNKINQE